jgi:NitT/TauT family transport system substrate-binding protein
MRRRPLLLFALLIGLVVAAAAMFAWRSPSNTDGAEGQRTTVTVAQVGEFFLYLPLYYAIDRGHFEREGLDVRLVNSGGDEHSVGAVLSGSADFGVGDPTFAAIANEKGQQVRVVASVVNGVPFWGVTKRDDLREITDPSQLRGLTVATFPRPSTAYVLQVEMFRRGGLQPSIREAQFGSLLPLLDTGAADIVLELEPNVSTAAANGARVVYSLAERYPDFAITGVTVQERTIRERPDLVRRFVRALDAAERAAHARPDDLVAFAIQRFPSVPPAVAEAAARRMLTSRVLPSGARVSPGGWRAAVELRRQAGDLRSTDAAAGAVDNQFIP